VVREAVVGADRGQRHDHDRGVEDHHEERAAEERERPPAAGIEGAGAGSGRGNGARVSIISLRSRFQRAVVLVETPPPLRPEPIRFAGNRCRYK
jgi:hypothetical protein